jgi:hypothetical protein
MCSIQIDLMVKIEKKYASPSFFHFKSTFFVSFLDKDNLIELCRTLPYPEIIWRIYFPQKNYTILTWHWNLNSARGQRYTYRVLQTIQMKLILYVSGQSRAVMGSGKTALKFKYEI